MARDEMPVTDVKRIAKLFKDSGISEGTKSKLLYKSGHELLETWSVVEHNKKERAKAAAQAEESAQEKQAANKKSVPDKSAPQPISEAAAVPIPDTVSLPKDRTAPDAGRTETIQGKLLTLLEALPAYSPIAPESLQSIKNLPSADKNQLQGGIDTLIEDLEKHLLEWKSVRERIL